MDRYLDTLVHWHLYWHLAMMKIYINEEYCNIYEIVKSCTYVIFYFALFLYTLYMYYIFLAKKKNYIFHLHFYYYFQLDIFIKLFICNTLWVENMALWDVILQIVSFCEKLPNNSHKKLTNMYMYHHALHWKVAKIFK